MEKTYKLLDHTEPLPIDEIRRLYKGYWVYIVKAKIGKFGEILSGVPVVIGKKSADGAYDGIYNKYRTEEYEVRTGLNLLSNKFLTMFTIAGDYFE